MFKRKLLYLKYCDFPKRLNVRAFAAFVAVMYALFCFDPDFFVGGMSFKFNLFNNNFNEPNYLSWFISSIYLHSFLIGAYRASCVLIKDRLVKSVFYALMIDSIISLLNTIIWGYYNPTASIIIRNIFVTIAVLYAYFILPHERD